MKQHTIYHIPGQKVGCTDNFERRKATYPKDTIFEVLDELEGQTDKAAGDLEFFYADMYGYPRGSHYARMCEWAASFTPEQLSARATKGNDTLGVAGRSARSSKGNAKRLATWGADGLSKKNKQTAVTLGPDGCSARVRAAAVTLGPEGLTAKSKKGWETRRRKMETA